MTLPGAINPSQNSCWSHGNEGVFHIVIGSHQIDYFHIQDTRWESLPLFRDTVGAFYSLSRLGWIGRSHNW